MKTLLKILVIIIAILLIIQLPFFTPKKNFTKEDTSTAIVDKYEVPMNIQMILYNGCFDCHSNYTENYPWYYHIQPVSWWMDWHIQEAKKHVNFSEFARYTPQQASKRFKELQEVMEEHAMPLKSYLWMHKDAKLTEKQYQQVAAWAKEMHEKMEAKLDSLAKD